MEHIIAVTKRQLFVPYVALGIIACSILFLPWAMPRETLSGLMGRWSLFEGGWKRRFGGAASAMIDWMYSWEPDHCLEVATVEAKSRELLYPGAPGESP